MTVKPDGNGYKWETGFMKLRNTIWFCPPPPNIKQQIDRTTAEYSPPLFYISITLSLFLFGQYRPISALFKRRVSISKKEKEISPNVESILMCRRVLLCYDTDYIWSCAFSFLQTNKQRGLHCSTLVRVIIGCQQDKRTVVRGNVAWWFFAGCHGY